jgi:hypothetical protein
MAASKRPKPRGFKAFEALARRLLQVPKEELDKQLAKRKVKRRKK